MIDADGFFFCYSRRKTFSMDRLKRLPIATTTLILAGLLAAAPLWGPGLVNTRGGGDSPFLLQRTHQMAVNLRAGVFPARWMPDAAYGLGYPFFNYYAALPYYLTGALVLIGWDVLTAIKLVQTLGFVAAALAMYGWTRPLTSQRWRAWLAALAYTFAPFHMVNVYVRGDSLSEFYAFIFYPLILWALDRVSTAARNGRPAGPRVITAALAYAGLILTHNLSAAMFSPFALLYLLALAWQANQNKRRVLGQGMLALGLGVLLSAWFWLPAVAELGAVQLGPSTQDYFHYSRHFRSADLVQWRAFFDYGISPDGSTPFAMGLAQAALAILGGVLLFIDLLRRRIATRARWAFILLGLLISTLMITPFSRFLWDHLPVLPVVQFPWRFLSIQALFAAAATSYVLRPTSEVARPTSEVARPTSEVLRPVCAVLAVVVLAAAVLVPLRPDRLPIGPADVTVERLQLYELFAGNIGTTIRYEWLPQTVNPRPYTSEALVDPESPDRAIALDGATLEATLVERGPIQQTWVVKGDGGDIAFPLHFWPGWQARMNQEHTTVWAVEGSGYLALAVPPGEHTVTLKLARTPARWAGELISLATLLGLATLIILQKRGQTEIDSTDHRRRSRSTAPRHISYTVILILCLLTPTLQGKSPDETSSDMTMDFIQMPYLHHNPEGVRFGDRVTLTHYTLTTPTGADSLAPAGADSLAPAGADKLAPGDRLAISLNCSYTGGPYTATVRLVSPAAVRNDGVGVLAEASARLETASLSSPSKLALRLPDVRLPDDLARGVYLLQLHLADAGGALSARTPQGSELGAVYLQPVRVPHGPTLPEDLSALAHFGPSIRLHGAQISQPADGRLNVELTWSAVHPIAANYSISLRLVNDEGRVVRQNDIDQLGYGFLPTSVWRPGEKIVDRYTLPPPTEAGAHHLLVILYLRSTGASIGQARLGDFSLPLAAPFEAQRPPRNFTLPTIKRPLAVNFGDEIRLAGYEIERARDALHLTLWWQALVQPADDYTVFVHCFDPATDENVVQHDMPPREGAYPTSWWAAGEVVSETVTLSLADVPAGAYRLALGLYDRSVTRLPASQAETGERLPDERLILPPPVVVEE